MSASRIIRAIWAVCLILAGLNHARILLQNGLLWDYGGAHPLSALYWSSLTLFDPLVAALLFIRPRAGIVTTLFLIGTNVAHNLAIRLSSSDEFISEILSSQTLTMQIAFLLFVIASAPTAWRGLKNA